MLIKSYCYQKFVGRDDFDSSKIALSSLKSWLVWQWAAKVYSFAFATIAFAYDLCIAQVYGFPSRIIRDDLSNPQAFLNG